jgi:hypothetical protein
MNARSPKTSIMLVCKQLRNQITDRPDVSPVLRTVDLSRAKASLALMKATAKVLKICRVIEIVPSPPYQYTIDL